MSPDEQIKKLREQINYPLYRYHVLDSPVISDAQYDALDSRFIAFQQGGTMAFFNIADKQIRYLPGHIGLVSTLAFDPQSNLDLGQEGLRVLTVAVLVEVALLPAKALDFADAERLQRRSSQTGEDLFGQVRLDDRDDLFHSVTIRVMVRSV